MSDNLAAITARARCLLKDSAGLAWSEAELGECIHQALDDLNQAAGQSWSLSGLEGAVSTDLPSGMASLLVRGAAAYALLMLAASRADLFNFQPGVCQAYTAAGEALLRQFQHGLAFLAQVRVSGLHGSGSAPYPTDADELPAGWRLEDDSG
jgi:hypothetical protein